jgi:hypothetical protein
MFSGGIVIRIDPSISRKFNGQTLILLRVLVKKLRLSPKTVYGWARRGGVRGHRLPTICLAGWRHTTIQAFNQFVADVNGWVQPRQKGDQLSYCLGLLVDDDDAAW